jgi:predicted DsbA family dithiol-disulfide isomerase
MFEHLRQRGKRYEMVFNDRDRSSNSHASLVAGEFAKDVGLFELFHENLFKAFFTDLKDIGQFDTLIQIATGSGLNPEELTMSLTDGRYEESLDVAAGEAKRLGIRSIPAFVFANDEIIFGAQSPENFRAALQDIENGTYRSPLI